VCRRTRQRFRYPYDILYSLLCVRVFFPLRFFLGPAESTVDVTLVATAVAESKKSPALDTASVRIRYFV